MLYGLHSRLDFVDCRDHDDFDQAVVLFDDQQDFEATDARQANVEQHQVDVFAVQNWKGGFAARHAEYAVLTLQDRRQRVTHALVVDDDEDGFLFMNHWIEGNPAVARCCGRRLTLLQAVR